MLQESDRTTTVNRLDLLKKLKNNREDHLKEYNEALEGYLEEAKVKIEQQKEKALQEVEKAYNRVNHELDNFDPEKAQDTIVFCNSISFHLVAPKNFVEAYDQAIEMMEWETNDTVELSTTEFRSFIMNKWDWMESFKMSSARYLK